MMADSRKELEDMARKLNLKESWFHRDHYNICKSKRLEALDYGAISVTSRELVVRYRSKRALSPEELSE